MKHRKKRRGSDFILYVFIRLLIAPPGWCYRIMALPIISLISSGWLTERLSIIQRIRNNLGIVFPEMDRKKKKDLLKKVLWQTVISTYESGHLYRAAWLKKVVTVEGLAYLDEALKQKKGVVVLSAHLGSFTLILAYLRMYGYPIRNIGRDPDNPYLARYFEKVRRKAKIVHIPKNPLTVSTRESLRWLKEGNILSLPADQHTSHGIAVPFFNHNVRTPTGPVVFARRLDCAVLPVSIVRRDKKHVIRIEPPFNLVRTDNPEEDIRQNTILFNQVIERWVRSDPDQWFGWFTRRFRGL
ncbi:MAG: lysophospholipid acyltransferase family protein [Candidatus Omnitrophota bacterium]